MQDHSIEEDGSYSSNVQVIDPLPTQCEIINCKARNILALGGIGAGKSATGVYFILKMVSEGDFLSGSY
jgi:hypothetical protein